MDTQNNLTPQYLDSNLAILGIHMLDFSGVYTNDIFFFDLGCTDPYVLCIQ